MTHPYEDILYHSYPFPTGRPRMSAQDRAAQFSPFAALTGYEDSIAETARRTTKQIELSEDAKKELNQKLTLLQIHADQAPPLSVTYFQPDLQKQGGAYITAEGNFWRIDSLHHILQLKDGTELWLEDIIRLESPIF